MQSQWPPAYEGKLEDDFKKVKKTGPTEYFAKHGAASESLGAFKVQQVAAGMQATYYKRIAKPYGYKIFKNSSFSSQQESEFNALKALNAINSKVPKVYDLGYCQMANDNLLPTIRIEHIDMKPLQHQRGKIKRAKVKFQLVKFLRDLNATGTSWDSHLDNVLTDGEKLIFIDVGKGGGNSAPGKEEIAADSILEHDLRMPKAKKIKKDENFGDLGIIDIDSDNSVF